MDFIGIKTFGVGDSAEEQVNKVLEEVNELFAEVHDKERFNYVAIADEAIDTVVAIANLLRMLGITYSDVQDAIKRVNSRNDERYCSDFILMGEEGFVVGFTCSEYIQVVYSSKRDATLRFSTFKEGMRAKNLLHDYNITVDVIPYATHP